VLFTERAVEQLKVRLEELTKPLAHTAAPAINYSVDLAALDHLDQLSICLQLPRRAVRLRLSCMWPLLFAVADA